MKLNKNSYIPLSKQLEEIISERIIRGTYKVSEKIPSQESFVKEFNISRITVRNCMTNLIQKGILESFKGKGTYIKEVPSISDQYHSHSGLTAQLRGRHQKLETLIISKQELKPDNVVAEALAIDSCHDVYRIERIRKINSNQFSYELNYLNPRIINNDAFLSSFTNNTSMYNMLLQLSHIEVDYAKENITAIVSDKKIEELLCLDLNTPLLKVKRLTFAKDIAEPFEYTEYVIKSEYYGTITYRNMK